MPLSLQLLLLSGQLRPLQLPSPLPPMATISLLLLSSILLMSLLLHHNIPLSRLLLVPLQRHLPLLKGPLILPQALLLSLLR